jgi:hypothetical protein
MGSIVPTNGTVTFEMQGSPHSDVTINVGDTGRFDELVQAGTWEISGRSPKFGDGQYVCVSGGPTVVTAKHRVTVSVECLEK